MNHALLIGLPFVFGLTIDLIHLWRTPARKHRFRTSPTQGIAAIGYRASVFSGLGVLDCNHLSEVSFFSGRCVWFVLSLAVGLWYLSFSLPSLLNLLQSVNPEAYRSGNWGRCLLVPAYWITFVVASGTWILVVVIILGSIFKIIGGSGIEFGVVDVIGFLLGLLWLRAVPIVLESVANEIDPKGVTFDDTDHAGVE